MALEQHIDWSKVYEGEPFEQVDSLYAASIPPARTHYYTIYAEHYDNGVPDEPKRAVEIHVNSRKLALNWTQDLQIAAFEDGLTIRYFFEEESEKAA